MTTSAMTHREHSNQILFDLCGRIDSMSREYLVNPSAELLGQIHAADRIADVLRASGSRAERVVR